LNNQRNNNRRRGRGNNRGGNGGGNPINRIDSRARGNAPQLLEKYRKLAHEASLNDDRVQTEYYLQFADHYFRVIADAKAQKDEQQGRQRAERDADDGEDYVDDDRFDDRSRRQQPPRQDRAPQGDDDAFEAQRGTEGDEDEGENPFLAQQPARQQSDRQQSDRQPREKRDRDGRREGRDRDDRGRRPRNQARGEERGEAEEPAPAFDPGMLPPSIPRTSDVDVDSDEADEAIIPVADAEPARKPRRPRTPRRKAEGEDEELQATN
jgi:hypothetical protein